MANFFTGWTWKKWVSRLFALSLGIMALLFKLVAPEAEPNWLPSWWVTLSPLLILVVNGILALFPDKT